MKPIVFMLFSASLFMACTNQEQTPTVDLFIGTYTNTGNSIGIYKYAFDPSNGQAILKDSIAAENPSFLARSANGKYLYVVNENGNGQGAVSAYALGEGADAFVFLNSQLTQGDHPCHIITDGQGRYVIVSNYSGGNLSVFPIEEDGSIGALVQLIQHEGSGPDRSRQNNPHVHSAFFSPDEKRIYVQDLGTDKINIYDFRPENTDHPLVPSEQPYVMGAPGGGPRHIALSADGRYIYLVQELTANVMVYANQSGQLTSMQEIAMNEETFDGANGAADIKLSPDGKFLYASNRGDANTLAIYAVNSTDGQLTKVGNQSVLGHGPRNFTLSPDGKFLLVGNQHTHEVVVFARDVDTGLLHDTGNRIAVGTPVCLVF